MLQKRAHPVRAQDLHWLPAAPMLPIHRTKLTVFNYDEIPPGYYFKVMLNGSAIQRFWHQEKFREIAGRIRDNESVLDVGCGPGSFLHILGEERPDVRAMGVDIASGQIDFATREIASRFPDGRISFTSLAPGEVHFPFPSQSFDVITSIEVIEHLHPHVAFQMIQEAKRVLKEDGRMIVSTPNYRSFWPLLEIVLEAISPVKYHDQHISKFTPNSLVKFLETAGFEVKSLCTIFTISPFIAPFSRMLASLLRSVGRKNRLKAGSLLIAEGKKLNLNERSA